jgi:hypothetical protein
MYLMWAGTALSVQQLGVGQTVKNQIPLVARFCATVQTGPGAHPASCTMGFGALSQRKSSQSEALRTHPHLALRLKKE